MKNGLEYVCYLLQFSSIRRVMRPKLMTSFVAALMIFIGTTLATAEQLRWRIDLTVDSIEEGITDISIGDRFIAEFEVDPSLFNHPDGVWDGRFVNFDLTIGDVNWNEFQAHSPFQFLLSPDGIDALSGPITVTIPAHPDLSFFLPASPAAWKVKDENDWAGVPIFGGDFGGTYTVRPIPDCVGEFDPDWDRDVDGSDLAGYLPASIDLEGFAAVFGSQDYCPRPEPQCNNPRNGWVVLKNDTRDITQLYVADMAYAWGETLPDTFLPADFPALVEGALVVDSMDEFAPGTYYLGELPVDHYSILMTRSAVRDLDADSTEEYIRVVYLNSDVNVVPCDQVAQMNIDASSYNAYDMAFPCETEEIEYEAFKTLLDNGQLTLVNNRIEAAQRAESERIYTENVQFVTESLEESDPEFLAFIETPILDDDINDPSGDNWHHTITHNSGETSIVTTLGKKNIFAVVAESLKAKGTIENERTVYLTLYDALETVVKPEDLVVITEELGLNPEAVRNTMDIDVIEIEKMKLFNNWDWIKDYIIIDAATMPPLKPSCENETGTPSFSGLGLGTTDQYGGHEAHASDGVFENYFYPLKWFATCVKNQKERGTSTAFGITGAVETSWAVQTYKWVNLSEQWLYYKAKNEWWPSNYGDGLCSLATANKMGSIFPCPNIFQFLYPYENQWIYNASIYRVDGGGFMYLDSCKGYGSCSVASPCSDTTHQGKPLCSAPFCGYYADKSGDSELTNNGSSQLWWFVNKWHSIMVAKHMLWCKIPLVLSYHVTPSFKAARPSGFMVYTGAYEGSYGGHASLVTGYIDNADITADMDVSPVEMALNGGGYFIVRNSWGGKWKDAGYIYIPYSWVKTYTYSLITVKAVKKP